MLSVESCRISFPVMSSSPSADEEAEVAKAVAAMEMMSLLSEVPKRPVSISQDVPSQVDEEAGVASTEDEERARLLIAFSDSAFVQHVSLSSGFDHAGKASSMGVSHDEPSPARDEDLPQDANDLFREEPNAEQSDSSVGSAFEEVQIMYLGKGGPHQLIGHIIGHHGVQQARSPAGPILQVTNPDYSSSSSTSYVPVRRVAQGPLRRRPRQPLRVVNPNLVSSSSRFGPLPKFVAQAQGKENTPNLPLVARNPGFPAVKRKPAPKMSVSADDPFLVSSTVESFPMLRAQKAKDLSNDPLAGLANRRTDVVRNLQLRRVLGKGAQGQVYLAHGPDPTKLFAVKVSPKHATDCVRMILQEQRLLHRLMDSPFILDLQGSFHDSENFYLVTGFHSGGDLRQFMKKKKVLDVASAKFYFAELVSAVSFIHRSGVVHRDIKPANILIKDDGHICLADFGMCKDWMSQMYYGDEIDDCETHQHRRDCSSDEDSQMTVTFAGTLLYMSPEVISREPYSFDADWWSLGITFYELLTGDIPWCGDTLQETADMIREAPLPYQTKVEVDATAKDLLDKLLRKEVSQRLKLPGIIEHPLFDDIDFDDVEDCQLSPPWIPTTRVSDLASGHLNYMEKVFVGEPYVEDSDPFPAYEYAGQFLPKHDPSNLQPSTVQSTDDDAVYKPTTECCFKLTESDLLFGPSEYKTASPTVVSEKAKEPSLYESHQFSDAPLATPTKKLSVAEPSLPRIEIEEVKPDVVEEVKPDVVEEVKPDVVEEVEPDVASDLPEPQTPVPAQEMLPLNTITVEDTPISIQQDVSASQDITSYLQIAIPDGSPQAASILSAISEEIDGLFSVNLFEDDTTSVGTSFASIPCLEYQPRTGADKERVPENIPKTSRFKWLKKAAIVADKFLCKVALGFKAIPGSRHT